MSLEKPKNEVYELADEKLTKKHFGIQYLHDLYGVEADLAAGTVELKDGKRWLMRVDGTKEGIDIGEIISTEKDPNEGRLLLNVKTKQGEMIKIPTSLSFDDFDSTINLKSEINPN